MVQYWRKTLTTKMTLYYRFWILFFSAWHYEHFPVILIFVDGFNGYITLPGTNIMIIEAFSLRYVFGLVTLFATINNARRSICLYLSPCLCLFLSFLAERFKYFKVSYIDTFAFQNSSSKFSVWNLNIFLSKKIAAFLEPTSSSVSCWCIGKILEAQKNALNGPTSLQQDCLEAVDKISLPRSVLFALYIFYEVPQWESWVTLKRKHHQVRDFI